MIQDYQTEADLLYDEQAVEEAIDNTARELGEQVERENPLLVCILNGGLVFYGKMLTKLNFPLEVDYVHVSRYQDNVGGSELRWISGPHADAKGRTIVLVDDILDEGSTLAGIVDFYNAAGAKRVITVVLVEKDRQRKASLVADFVGLKVPDRYVFGYGMDYKGYWRNAPGIYAEKEKK